jgi:hypothetical protein
VKACDARASTPQQTIGATKQTMREKPQLAIRDIARSDCTTAVFLIHAFDDGMAQMLSPVVEVAQIRVTRTLSRDFWQ